MILSKNFTEKEFLCRCGRCDHSKNIVVHPKLIKALQDIRDIEGEKLEITSGARCEFRNQQTPGASSQSWHIPRHRVVDKKEEYVLHAADFTFLDTKLRTPNNIIRLHTLADQEHPKGLGLYHGRVHMDFRTTARARWIHVSWSWSNLRSALSPLWSS